MKAAVLALLAACGGTSTTTPSPAAPSATATATLPDAPFDSLDHDQKVQYMKQKVMPEMKVVFQQHDPKKFSDFTCKTCHGKGAADGTFDMPNPELPKLVVKELMAGTSKYKQADIEWMSHDVKPRMAKLVSMPEWTPQNPKGFGCGSCHPIEE